MIRIAASAAGVTLPVRAVPGASSNSVAGEHNGALKVRVNAAPEKGKANDELTEFLAGVFGVRKSAVEVVKGLTSRDKIVCIKGVLKPVVEAALERILKQEQGPDKKA